MDERTWQILRKYQRQIFNDLKKYEEYEDYNRQIIAKEVAIIIGNMLKDIDEKRFIEEFELNDSENCYDDIDDPLFNDGGNDYTDTDNDEDVKILDDDMEIYRKTMIFKGRS
jgi:hypothetical protein